MVGNFFIRSSYYFLRPVIPIRIRWLLQRKVAKRINGFSSDPMWPLPVLTYLDKDFNTTIDTKLPFILTHDVDTQFGFYHIKDVINVERKLDLKSCWNVVPNLYKIHEHTIDYLRECDMELGVHDWNHDGKLFSNSKIFNERVVKINKVIKQWGAHGFRAGMVFHNDEWMQKLECEYDSSYYDSDPYQPMGSGCKLILPFMLGHLVELPYTMPQDHVLFIQSAKLNVKTEKTSNIKKQYSVGKKEVLDYVYNYCKKMDMKSKQGNDGRDIYTISGIDIWKIKSQWLYENKGMVLMVTHPDYLCNPKLRIEKAREAWLEKTDYDIQEVRDRKIILENWYGSLLEQYAAFLNWFLRTFKGRYWHCLPKEIVSYWRNNHS